MKARLMMGIIGLMLIFTIIAWAAGLDLGLFGRFYLRYLGLLFASLGLVLIFLQFVFVSRVKAIEAGIGLDRMFRWHRFFGRAGLIMIALHAILILIHRFISFGGSLLLNPYIWIGIIALLGFTVTAGLASTYKRLGLAYELWRNIHLMNYLLFPVVLIHVFFFAQAGAPLYYFYILLALLFGTVIIYRAQRIINIRRRPYRVTAVRQEADDIWSLYLKGPRIDYKPGQFMFIQLLRKGKLSSAHPFTISASPTSEHLSITPKALGDFTASIKDTGIGDYAYIDAPYGVFSFLNHNQGDLVFIAGGIGITPFMSMLRYMDHHQLDKKVTLFWANRSENNLCFREELDQLQDKMPGFRAVLVMSDQPDWQGEKGYIKGEMMLRYLDTVDNKEFFVCGPPAMSRATVKELKQINAAPSRIHTELFEL